MTFDDYRLRFMELFRQLQKEHETICQVVIGNSQIEFIDVANCSGEEEWRPVVGYEGLYDVSNKGKVRRVKNRYGHASGRILSQYIKLGYCHVLLFKDGSGKNFRVHRLVAMTYIPNPNNLEQVNHIDGNKTNNSVENLEWVSPTDNVIHSIVTGLRKTGDESKRTKIHKEQLCEIYGLRRLGFSFPAIGEILGMKTSTVRARFIRKSYVTYYGEREFERMVCDYVDRNRGKLIPIDKRKFLKGRWRPKAVIKMNKSGEIVGSFNSVGDAARAAELSTHAISSNLCGRSNYCGGYKYVYK